MPETIRELVVSTLAELIDLCVFLAGPGSSLWKDRSGEGLAECNYCHHTARTVPEIQHFQGCRAGDKIDGVVQLFDEPPCRAITMLSAVDRARKVLDLLINSD